MTKKKSKNEDPDVYEDLEKNFKKRGLGRGLDALFQDDEGDYPQLDESGQPFKRRKTDLDASPDEIRRHRRLIGVAQIQPGVYQPRTTFKDDSLEELARSIKTHGILQPLLVRPHPHNPDSYEIVAGERRWRAAQIAGIHEIPVIIKDLSDKVTLEIGLIENLQREDLNPLDEATALSQLIGEFEYTQEEVGSAIGKSRSYVANMIRLMKLPEKVLGYLRDESLSAGHARALITADDPVALADEIIKGGMNVRDVETFMSQSKGRSSSKKSKSKKAPAKGVNMLALENEVSDKLGLRVSVDMKDKEAGTVSISFKTWDQLDDVVHRLSQQH